MSRELLAQSINRKPAFVGIGLSLLMTSIDMTITAAALPAIQRGLNTSVDWVGWTITGYSLGLVLFLPICGLLSPHFGHVKVFVASLVIFLIASALCGVVDSITLLILLRIVQAVGGAGVTPAATGIVVRWFGRERDRALGLFGAMFPLGAILGPACGGLIVTHWSWRWIFFMNVPVAVIAILLVLRNVPIRAPESRRLKLRVDVIGLLMIGLCLTAAMLASSITGQTGAMSSGTTILVLGGVSALSLVLFIIHIRRTDFPIIRPRFLYGRSFGAINALNALYSGAQTGVIVLVPLFAIERYSLSAVDGGLLLTTQGIATIISAILTTMMIRTTGYRGPLYIGSTLIAMGTLLLGVPPLAGITSYTWLLMSMVLIGLGNGLINPSSRNATLQLAPDDSSALAAIRTLFMQVGTIITVAVTTSLLAGTTNIGHTALIIYFVVGIVLLLFVPLNRLVPDHRDSW